jgi:hypothetical protein
MMSHAKIGNADPGEVAKFIVPYYQAMLKAMDGEGKATENKTDDEKNRKVDASEGDGPQRAGGTKSES